jgi:hypothetical protein
MTALLLLLFVACYFLPTIVAALRKHPSVGAVAVINFFFGWTVIGWILALAKAAGNARRGDVIVQQTIMHHTPASPLGASSSGSTPLSPATPLLDSSPADTATSLEQDEPR